MIEEVVFFSNNRNWVIGGIARETIVHVCPKPKVTVLPNTKLQQLSPKSFFSSHMRYKFDKVLFLGASTFFTVLRKKPNATFKNSRVFFTHLIAEGAPTEAQVNALNLLDKIFTMNDSTKRILQNVGVKTEIQVVFGAVDSTVFYPSKLAIREKDYVLIVSHAAPRKRPELILEFIKESSEFHFIIHGKEWAQFDTSKIRNLEIKEFVFKDQPVLVRNAAALLSLSWVEGGPFPLIEALASGTPVVSSSTGFAPDLINKNNGRIVQDVHNFEEIRKHLRDTLLLKEKVAGISILPTPLSWELLSEKFYG